MWYKGEFVTNTSCRKNFFRSYSKMLGPLGPKWYLRSQSEGLITLRKEINNRYFPDKFRKRRNHVILISDSEYSAKNTLYGRFSHETGVY